jgi:hypothetical protein
MIILNSEGTLFFEMTMVLRTLFKSDGTEKEGEENNS